MSYIELIFPFFAFLALAGLISTWRNSVAGQRPWLITIGIAGLFFFSLNPVAWLLSRPLETGYDHDPIPKDSVDAIVVLAGAVASPFPPENPYPVAGHDTYVRIQRAAWLFKHWASLPILACGGGQDSESYSQMMRHLLQAEGVPPDSIWIESRSRTTYENALFGSRILRERGISRIALVTDAPSMNRAVASFTKQGMTVVPAPFQFHRLELGIKNILPTADAIEDNSETAHEVIGMLWYWLRGRI